MNKDFFLFLGSGGSLGVPVIGCTCTVCTSPSPYNKRLRSAGLLQIDGKRFLIDAGPDVRTQALTHNVVKLDGVLITHTHFDHIAGFDDLRAYYLKTLNALPCLLSKESFHDLKRTYHYMIKEKEGKIFSDIFDFYLLENDFGVLNFQGIELQYLSYHQAGMKVTGFRRKDFAYVSDIRDYTEGTLHALLGVKTLVLSALRHDPSYVHFSLEEAIAFSRKVKAEKTWITHIAHDLDHEKTNAILPPEIRMSYDGLKITL